MNKLTVYLPWPDRRLSPNARLHWSQRYKATKHAKHHAFLAAHETGVKLQADNFQISYVFHPPDRRVRDIDNLIAACKSYQDGLFDYLGIDDYTVTDIRPQWGDVIKGGRVFVTVEILPHHPAANPVKTV